MMRRKQFADEGAVDGHRCPDGQMPASATTERNGYRHYNSGPAVCKACPRLASCTSNARAQRPPNPSCPGRSPATASTPNSFTVTARTVLMSVDGAGAMPPRRHRSRHQEDRSGADRKIPPNTGARPRVPKPPPNPNSKTSRNLNEEKPRQNDGVCQQSEAADRSAALYVSSPVCGAPENGLRPKPAVRWRWCSPVRDPFWP